MNKPCYECNYPTPVEDLDLLGRCPACADAAKQRAIEDDQPDFDSFEDEFESDE